MIFNSEEFIIMAFLFMVGGGFGFVMTLNRLYEMKVSSYDEIILLLSALAGGFFGIIGGGVTLFFLPEPTSFTMMATGGLILSGVTSLFTIDEKKIFVGKVIKRLVAVAFNLKLK